MKTVIKVALAILVGSGALLLMLGIFIWTGIGDHERLVAVHITIGVVLVLTLWTIAAIAARSGVAASTVAFASAWGLLVVLFGLAQEDLQTGSWHWTIQVLHVAISMGAIWWGRRLVQLMQRAQSASQPSVAHPPRRHRRLAHGREQERRSHAEHQGSSNRVPGQQAGGGHGSVPDAADTREQQRLQAPARTWL